MRRRRVCVVTGSRAEFGLLRPVMQAIESHDSLELSVIVAGSHLLPPAETWRGVGEHFDIGAKVPMQEPGATGRLADARALGLGVLGFADAFERLRPDWVVVLGDRIEALAAASAASVGGIAVAHIHGGDRAEGVADEAMRHAITKLAHLHLPASPESAARIIRMGEPEQSVVCCGSPAIDGLDPIPPLDEAAARAFVGCAPRCVLLLHPCGLADDAERAWASAVVEGVGRAERGSVAVFAPNHDPGRDAVMPVLRPAAAQNGWAWLEHLPRDRFIGLLKWLAGNGGVLVGNSSAGLIECAALGVPVVNVGPRQSGRERAGNVIDADRPDAETVAAAIRKARELDLSGRAHPFGDGRAAGRIAGALAHAGVGSAGFLRKRNSY